MTKRMNPVEQAPGHPMSCIAFIAEGDIEACGKPTRLGARFCDVCGMRQLVEAETRLHQADLAAEAARTEIMALVKELNLP